MIFRKPTRRHFTDAARAAAAEARRRKREMRVERDCPEVFVVRQSDLDLHFRWEIRRFGGVVLDRSGVGFSCVQDARSAGEVALSSFTGGAATFG